MSCAMRSCHYSRRKQRRRWTRWQNNFQREPFTKSTFILGNVFLKISGKHLIAWGEPYGNEWLKKQDRSQDKDSERLYLNTRKCEPTLRLKAAGPRSLITIYRKGKRTNSARKTRGHKNEHDLRRVSDRVSGKRVSGMSWLLRELTPQKTRRAPKAKQTRSCFRNTIAISDRPASSSASFHFFLYLGVILSCFLFLARTVCSFDEYLGLRCVPTRSAKGESV